MINIPDHIAADIVFRILASCECKRVCVCEYARTSCMKAYFVCTRRQLDHDRFNMPALPTEQGHVDSADSTQDAHIQQRGDCRICGELSRKSPQRPDHCGLYLYELCVCNLHMPVLHVWMHVCVACMCACVRAYACVCVCLCVCVFVCVCFGR